VDDYQAHITDAIFAASNQQILNQCAEGDSAACAAVTRNAGVVTQINVVPLNLARQTNRGLDFEASYRRHLAPAPFLDGDLSARVLATYYLENSIDSGIAGVPVTNNVGTNSDGVSGSSSLTLPRWRLQADVGWEQGPVTLGFTMRGVSAGVYNTSYIQCTANCPVATAANPTIDNNHIPGAFYFDANAGYTLSDGVRAFLVVQNLADTPPVARAFGTSLGGPPVPTSPTLYDVLGRTFRVGIRFKI
jgi:outer membrane receptor protein involved in Fe transport